MQQWLCFATKGLTFETVDVFENRWLFPWQCDETNVSRALRMRGSHASKSKMTSDSISAALRARTKNLWLRLLQLLVNSRLLFQLRLPMLGARVSQCTWVCLCIRLLSKADFRKESSFRLTVMIGSNSRNCVRQWIIMLGSFSWCAQKFKIRKKWRVALCPEELKNVPRWEKLRWNN